jgi:hypothetical protein
MGRWGEKRELERSGGKAKSPVVVEGLNVSWEENSGGKKSAEERARGIQAAVTNVSLEEDSGGIKDW